VTGGEMAGEQMDHARCTTRGGRARRAALAAVALAVVAVLAPLVPGAPVSAAPPPATHPGVVNPNPIDNTPHIVGTDVRTEAVLDLGTRVIVGGKFTQVKAFNKPTVFNQPYLFAYDKATGVIDTTFRPNPNGRVSALLRASDGGVLVSGQFQSIGGRAIPYLAKLDPVTGAASATFAPRPNGMVYDLHQAGGHLYLGGTFSKVGGTTRTNFAVVDPATGAVRAGSDISFTSSVRGTTRVSRFDVTPDGRKLVVIGNFARVAGQVRENVAILDLNTAGSATLSSWRTDRYKDGICGGPFASWDTIIYDVDLSPDGTYFVIVTTGGAGGTSKLCDSATRWETNVTGVATPTWINWTGGDSLTSVAITGSAVYVAGHLRYLDNPKGIDGAGPGAVARPGIGAISPTTGKALPWNPGRHRGLVTPRLVPTAEGLYVLNDSDFFAGEHHPKLTYLTLSGTIPPPPGATPSATGTPVVTAATATTATVAWEAATASRPVTGHTVVAKAGTTVLATTEAGAGLSTTVSGLPAGRAVTFTVTPRTSVGAGPATTSAPAVLPFTSVDAFTARQFTDLVGRGPTGAELADWRARVGGGSVTPPAAVDGLFGSVSVDKVAAVVRLYQAYYQRRPDGAGFRYWRDEVRRGKSINQISQSFATAKEFRTLYGSLDDGAFVDRVYQNVLGRAPDRAGRAYWVGQLRKGVSRGAVMTGFSESGENKNATRATTDVVLVIHLMLDRKPTTPELTYTGSRAELVRTILAGAEYDARV
jgi:hypothetical protein